MKHIKHWLATMAVLLCSVTANAHNFEVGGIYYNITSKENLTVEVTFKGDSYYSYSNEYTGTITIPATVTYNGVEYSVTSIGNEAFYLCGYLTSINIPASVTSIGDYVFRSCSSLTSVNIPASVTSIGEGAFQYCSNLTSINIPEGVTIIEEGTFYGCMNLTGITLPEGVTSIGKSAFSGCMNLTCITLPEGVTSIGDYAFYGCSSLISINIPDGVTSIGNNVFYRCRSLTGITLPDGVTSIGDYAFYECRSLISINIPDGVRSIGDVAFYGCSSLTSIIIPASVTSIGNNAFYECMFTTDKFINNSACVSNNNWGANLCDMEYDGAFVKNNVVVCCRPNATVVTLPEGITSIGAQAFYNCPNLTSITLPASVTSIGKEAFYICCNLASINIPEGVTSIENSTFYGCSSLTSITIPTSITSIGERAFQDCRSLTSITIPNGVTIIEKSAFSYCSSLTGITIPDGVTSIRDYAFTDCSSLTTIVLPKSVTYIGVEAFAYCPKLADVYFLRPGVPGTHTSVFSNSNPQNATLHVPASALDYFKGHATWSRFGKIETLKIAVTSITLSQSSASIPKGASLMLTATVAPDDATDSSVTWSSSDSDVATVDDMGMVTAIAPGTSTITATANDGSGVSAQCEVTVEATDVTLTINQYGSGTYCSEYALDFSEVEGLKAYAATGFNSSTGVVTLSRVKTAKAGVGLFIKGEPGNYVVPVMEDTDDNTLNMLVGTSEAVTMGRTSEDGLYVNYKYTLSGDNATPQFYVFDDGFTLGAGKAYLQVPAAWVQTEARSISLRFDDGETTKIENSKLRIENSTVIFDLMGRRVETPVKGGVYIVNGKKVIW